jgi:hypothetical protein
MHRPVAAPARILAVCQFSRYLGSTSQPRDGGSDVFGRVHELRVLVDLRKQDKSEAIKTLEEVLSQLKE